VNRERTQALLDRVASGELDSGEALRQLALPDTESMSFATIDRHRALRQGLRSPPISMRTAKAS
jgi:NCAIR mutase (PurE)-related protein